MRTAWKGGEITFSDYQEVAWDYLVFDYHYSDKEVSAEFYSIIQASSLRKNVSSAKHKIEGLREELGMEF